ncbi:MAG: Lrp/AsnC family transcriptional regulator [Cyclobacteriaceae bacterium]|nr:Lrp/AsnC family transcriptional regulator [Cyclobacteriaceae bacterium]
MNYSLDKIDLQIIHLLQKDAKIKIKEIAAELNMTNTPIFDRIKKLEQAGVITGYSTRIDKEKVGLHLVAFCSITLDKHNQSNIKQFELEVKKLKEVIECYHIAGMVDYLLKVVAKDMIAYQTFIATKLAALDNIGRVQSSFVMTAVKEDRILPLA